MTKSNVIFIYHKFKDNFMKKLFVFFLFGIMNSSFGNNVECHFVLYKNGENNHYLIEKNSDTNNGKKNAGYLTLAGARKAPVLSILKSIGDLNPNRWPTNTTWPKPKISPTSARQIPNIKEKLRCGGKCPI